jgi:hypothetical protein
MISVLCIEGITGNSNRLAPTISAILGRDNAAVLRTRDVRRVRKPVRSTELREIFTMAP